MKNDATARGRLARQRGSSILEGALVLTLALTSLIVIFELGITALIYQGVSERARDGARYAAVHPEDTTAITNVIVYGNPDGGGSPLLGLDPSRVTISAQEIDAQSEVVTIEVTVKPYPLVTRILQHGSDPITVRADIPVEDSSFEP